MISVGIDVSKDKSTVFAADENGEILLKACEYEHTEEGMAELIWRLKQLSGEVRIVVENTGYYHWPVVNSLLAADFFVCIVNSIVMSKFAKVQIRPGKTDRLDAMLICRFGLANWSGLIRCCPDEERRTLLRLYSREYSHAVHMVVDQKIHFTSLLDKAMPGIKALLEDKGGRSKLSDFALEFWHFDRISKQKPEAFAKRYCAWAKKKGYPANESKAAANHTLSQNGIPMKDLWETRKNQSKNIYNLLCCLPEEKMDVDLLEVILKEFFSDNLNALDTSAATTDVRRLIRMYDYLRWAKK